jgi:outer membrane protein assembly factor BamE (lipoprotein component of BamABCDE complex)
MFTLSECQLKKRNKVHGINFLENRSNVLNINSSNQNDVINLLGKPHSKSLSNEDKWHYFERIKESGDIYKLGKKELVSNNVLELEFDKYGILVKKEFFNKDKMNKVKYSEKETVNTRSNKSFVDSFLSSIRQKMKRKK